ncbi:tetratricopeptide repeat protein [Solwaraspora sp. WMMD791]|uniref:SEL1-like repeat protein n=1 Tax=Solwaraspora sp. WMMD791 TaxID=3016086 RepID=UPI00249B8E9B|nr:tetratricopeptide repeat protein [Solwaraspora sp. WMMD791]WFE29853.1 tetratricopeptide repeat protein [Solwaraspora sp. WMMD791]
MRLKDRRHLMKHEVSGHASDHGRVFQQGDGFQYNVERAYFGAHGELLPFLPWVSNVAAWPVVRDCDPLQLGVHRSSIEGGNAVPRYVGRDVDQELVDAILEAARRGGFILIVGDSTAGKSRAAYEAMLRTVPEYRVFIPDNGPDLRAGIVALFAAGEKCVLWLDDVERYFGVDGLTPGLLSQLRTRRVVVVATMRTERYQRFSRSLSRSDGGDDEHRKTLAATEHILNQAIPILVPRLWTRDELSRAAESDDQRIADALGYAETYGLAEYMAAGPKLYREWRQAWGVGANPRGAALVAAAVDCTRVGLTGPVPVRLLEAVHHVYLEQAGGALLRPESIEAGVEWAQSRRYGVTSLLLPGKLQDSYRVFDYLPDAYARSTDYRPVPGHTWDTAIQFFQGDMGSLYSIAIAAENEHQDSVAESVWRDLAQVGDGDAAEALGRLMWRTGRRSESIQWLEIAVEQKSVQAAFRLGWIYEKENDLPNAELWFTKASELGHAHSMLHLAQLFSKVGRLGEAERWGRRAAAENELQATATLGHILASSGKLDDALTLLSQAGDEGDGDALVSLGVVLSDQSRQEEAEEAWHRAFSLGSRFAAGNLALLYARQKKVREAEQWYRKAIELKLPESERRFGIFLMERGRNTEAEKTLLAAAADEDVQAFYFLGILYNRLGRREQAISWLERAVLAEVEGSHGLLAATLEAQGREDEAEELYREGSRRGDRKASYNLGLRLALAERFDEAEEYLRLAGEGATDEAALANCELGRLLFRSARIHEAGEALRCSLEAGHTHAGCMLAEVYLVQGKLADAEIAWRTAYAGGEHVHAAQRLASYYLKIGKPDLASLWLGRSRGFRGRKGGKNLRVGKGKRKPGGRR